MRREARDAGLWCWSEVAAIAHLHNELAGCSKRAERRRKRIDIERSEDRNGVCKRCGESGHRPEGRRDARILLLVVIGDGGLDRLQRLLFDRQQDLEIYWLRLAAQRVGQSVLRDP
jgi:hypothetical protein